jgi:hypothetical protein
MTYNFKSIVQLKFEFLYLKVNVVMIVIIL